MKVWLALPAWPVPALIDLTVAIEEVGGEGVAISDHVCVPAAIRTTYPYTGRAAVLPNETEFPEPLILATALGGVTTRLRFMTYALLLPLRHPVLLAKEAATASAATGGRVDLGVGAGWMREEFDALGVPFEQRGSIMDEALPLLRRLWTGMPVAHRGGRFVFEALASHPIPPAPIDVFVAGHTTAALRRAALLAEGWIGMNPTLDELARILSRLIEVTRGGEVRVRTGVKGRLPPEDLAVLAALGVEGLVVHPWQVGAATPARPLHVETAARRFAEVVSVAEPMGPSSTPD